MKDLIKRHYITFRKFSVVGVVNTVLDFTVFFVLHSVFDVPVVQSHVLAFMVAVVNSFIMNALWTFQGLERDKLFKQVIRFFTISFIGLGLSSVAIQVASYFMYAMFAKVVAVFVSFIWNYIGYKAFVFKN